MTGASRFGTTKHFQCGHERTPENSYTSSPVPYRKKDGTRVDHVYEICKICQKARAVKWYREHKAQQPQARAAGVA